MSPKIFFTMVLATAAIGVVASMQLRSRAAATQAAESGELLFPSFEERINDVGSVHVQIKDGSFTLERDGDGWGLAESGGYPADATLITQFLFELKDAELVEKKTANPARFDKLGLRGVEDPESAATLIRVNAQDDSELAALLVGNQRASKGGPARDSYYVRKPSEDQSWLVDGKLALSADKKSWLEKEILNVDAARMRSVEIVHADGERVLVSKPDETAQDFTLQDIPEGKELRYAGVAGSLASALANLTLDDVVKAEDKSFEGAPLSACTFTTFDGMIVEVALFEEDETLYANFKARYEAPPAAPEGEDATPQTPAADPAAVQAEVAQLSAKTADWTYVLPSWKKSSFVKRLDDMLKDVEPAPEEPAPTELPDSEALQPLLEDTTEDTTEGAEEGAQDADEHAGHDHGAEEGQDG